MKDIEFVKSIGNSCKLAFVEDIFLKTSHLYLQTQEGWHFFYLVDTVNSLCLARCSVNVAREKAMSPFRSSFGGIEFSAELDLKQLYFFIDRLLLELKGEGVRCFELKLPPQAYNHSRFVKLSNALFNFGFSVVNSELSCSIRINQELQFYDIVHKWEQRKLRKAYRLNIANQTVEASRLEEVYQFISFCREERGQSLSMAYPQLMQTVNAFPSHFLLFGSFLEGELVAAAICILINDEVMYNFYSAHARAFDALSPAVSLFEFIYNYCRQHHFRLLDLGTSALEGQPNFSLLDFKSHIGGDLNLKLTFQKQL